MCSRLWLLPKNSFMVSLEEEVIPTLTSYLCNWKRYVGGTHETWNEDCVGETDRRIAERIIDHNKSDKNSHLLKQSSVWDWDRSTRARKLLQSFEQYLPLKFQNLN